MRESIKVLCVVILLFAGPTAAVVWFDDRPNDTVWMVRWVASCLTLAAIVLFLKIHFRRDDLPDFLGRLTPHYFNRGGFCFTIAPAVVDGVLHVQAWFQNQHEGSLPWSHCVAARA